MLLMQLMKPSKPFLVQLTWSHLGKALHLTMRSHQHALKASTALFFLFFPPKLQVKQSR